MVQVNPYPRAGNLDAETGLGNVNGNRNGRGIQHDVKPATSGFQAGAKANAKH